MKLMTLTLPVLLGSVLLNAQQASPALSKTKEVEVYFRYENNGGPLVSGELYTLTRRVSKTAPLQGALAALVSRTTAEEENLGYQSAAYVEGMQLKSARIKRGIVYAHFTRPPIQGSPPDMASLKFEEAVIKTAKRFPGVRKVVVCVNGMNEFGIGVVEDAPRRCPKEVK